MLQIQVAWGRNSAVACLAAEYPSEHQLRRLCKGTLTVDAGKLETVLQILTIR